MILIVPTTAPSRRTLQKTLNTLLDPLQHSSQSLLASLSPNTGQSLSQHWPVSLSTLASLASVEEVLRQLQPVSHYPSIPPGCCGFSSRSILTPRASVLLASGLNWPDGQSVGLAAGLSPGGLSGGLTRHCCHWCTVWPTVRCPEPPGPWPPADSDWVQDGRMARQALYRRIG